MKHLLVLDLDRLRDNLQRASRASVTDEDVHRELAARGTRRVSDGLFAADTESLANFADGEVLWEKADEGGRG